MSRHQAFRSVQGTLDEHYYDDDDYEEEEELSAEDQAALRQGTAEVREALGVEADKVTTKQIEDALYHYYYDIDKSVTYLLTKFIAPPPPKSAKAVHKGKDSGKHLSFYLATVEPRHLSGSSAADTFTMPSRNCGHLPVLDHSRPRGYFISSTHNESSSLTYGQGHEFLHPYPPLEIPKFEPKRSTSAIFQDMPWGNVPQHRLTVFIEPDRPRGGLLGGSGAAPKLTRLQQLAAARKKKVGDKKPATSEDSVDTTRQEMQKLSVEERPKEKENQRPDTSGGFGKRQKLSETEAAGRMPLEGVVPQGGENESMSAKSSGRQHHSVGQNDGVLESTEEMPAPPAPAPELAPPSTFAQTLFGMASNEPNPTPTQHFALPYMAFCPSLADAFSQPSPDDVVLTAQAKGSITGKGQN